MRFELGFDLCGILAGGDPDRPLTIMSRAPRNPSLSGSFASCLSSAWLFARWMLVLVLTFDLVSAPFHHHQHDGVDGQAEVAAGHASIEADETHVEADDHALVSHSAMVIRVDPSRLAQLPAVDLSDASIAVTSAIQLLAALEAQGSIDWPPDRSAPDLRSHRSLPPASRAPPLHA